MRPAAVRHPPQSGWLDEWGCLKGSRPDRLILEVNPASPLGRGRGLQPISLRPVETGPTGRPRVLRRSRLNWTQAQQPLLLLFSRALFLFLLDGQTFSSLTGRTSGLPSVIVRHPPQSGWLDEWGCLKGSRPVGIGVALKRALVVDSQNCPAPSASSCSRM